MPEPQTNAQGINIVFLIRQKRVRSSGLTCFCPFPSYDTDFQCVITKRFCRTLIIKHYRFSICDEPRKLNAIDAVLISSLDEVGSDSYLTLYFVEIAGM